MYTSQHWANFRLTCVPENGRGFVTVRSVSANLVSKDARDLQSWNRAARSTRIADLSCEMSIGTDSAAASLLRVNRKVDDPAEIAEVFNEYFANIGPNRKIGTQKLWIQWYHTFLTKNIVNEIITPLTHILNLSLSSGTVPLKMK